MAINQDKKQTVQARETKKLLTRLTSAHADIQNHHATHTAIDHRIDSDLTLINNNVSCLVNEVWSRDKKLVGIEGELRLAKEQICIKFLV